MNNKKIVLITDAGGRGGALVDKYAQSKYVGKILAVPGNDLMQINTTKKVVTYPHLKTTDVLEIIKICQKEKVDLVDVSQDNAVEVGLVNKLSQLGIKAVGPSKEAGQIEWDKAWSREFMEKYQIPHPKFKVFNSEQEGIDFISKQKESAWFVKASGLAEGKGALPAKNLDEAVNAIRQMNYFGKSGEIYLLEEWLEGEEFSALALCDGKDFVYIGSAQDHKRVNDGDSGPNTGGMGCVSNPLIVNQSIKKQILTIFEKTLQGMLQENRPYKGVLYLGGMVVKDKVSVIEFNARWGDPEAEIILPSIKNELYEISTSIISGKLKNLKIKTDKKVRVVVAACAKGYPLDYAKIKGKKIFGIDEAKKIKGIKIYGAGIKKENNFYVVNGGRVLFIYAEGKNIVEAREKAYQAMSIISIEGDNLHYRTDIGWRDLERMSKTRK